MTKKADWAHSGSAPVAPRPLAAAPAPTAVAPSRLAIDHYPLYLQRIVIVQIFCNCFFGRKKDIEIAFHKILPSEHSNKKNVIETYVREGDTQFHPSQLSVIALSA